MRVSLPAWSMADALWYSEIHQDAAVAVRQLRRSFGFALVAGVTLALGIVATTAVYAVADAVMLRRLPFTDPAHLVLVRRALPGAAVSGELTYPEYLSVRDDARSFSGLAAVPSSLQPAIWTDGTSTEPLGVGVAHGLRRWPGRPSLVPLGPRELRAGVARS
jgi:hypothetical protein